MRVFVLFSDITSQEGILNGVSALQGCPPYIGVQLRGVHFTGVSILSGFPPERGVSYSGSCLTGVCAMHWYLPLGSVQLKVDFHCRILFMCIHVNFMRINENRI